MSSIAAFASAAALLLGWADAAVGATPSALPMQWAPRMERLATCSWDRPGHNPFMGDVVAAVDRYIDIPTTVRMRLKQRMQARQYDELVLIRRDNIVGRERYQPAIRDMHFGLDQVCREVTRERWTDKMQERGLVYCEQGHCILVPTVCRNVSRIERRPDPIARADSPEAGPPDGELNFDPPSAGPRSNDGAMPSLEAHGPERIVTQPPMFADTPPAGSAMSLADADPDVTPPTFGGPWPPGLKPTGNGGGNGIDGGGGSFGAGRASVPFETFDSFTRGDFPSSAFPIGGPGFSAGSGTGGSDGIGSSTSLADPPAKVPEPGSLASVLLALCVLALVSARQRLRRQVTLR